MLLYEFKVFLSDRFQLPLRCAGLGKPHSADMQVILDLDIAQVHRFGSHLVVRVIQISCVISGR